MFNVPDAGDKMKISRSYLVNEIRERWPTLKDSLPKPTNILISDPYFWCPTEQDIRKIVFNTYFESYKHSPSFLCADFAFLLAAFVKQERYFQAYKRSKTTDEWYPWAFGIVHGYFQDSSLGHAMNFCFSNAGKLWLIEPQNDVMRKANPAVDKVHWVEI